MNRLRPKRHAGPLAALALLASTPLNASSFALMQVDFAQPINGPCVSVVGDAKVADGLLRSTSMAHWKRGGLQVGPLPMPHGALTITYDFRPVRFGRQSQEFTSQQPSTHHYMVYASAGGWMNLHTRLHGKWQHRARSTKPLKLGVWYRARVTLTRATFRYAAAERDSKQMIWDSGKVEMDDIGKATAFYLTDEDSAAGAGSTEWDNFAVSCDDAAFAKRFAAEMEKLAEVKRRRERERRDAEVAAKELRSRGIALIPIPQRIALREGGFDLRAAALDCPAGLTAAARGVAMILKERNGISLPLRGTAAGKVTLARAAKAPWPKAKTRESEGYRLVISPDRVRIEADSRQGFLLAAQTLAQLARDTGRAPCCEIVDWPAIENRLVMIALSQGAWREINVDYWKRMIRELAAVKINMIMPYMDGGTFDYKKYPFLCEKGAGAMTHEKAKLLSEYAWQHGIELTPQIQTLGHSWAVLRHKQLAHLRESGGVFCSSKPEVWAFFSDLFDEMADAFPRARYQHVGGDEFGHGFGKCPLCKAKIAKIGRTGLYAEHMMHVRKLLADRGRKMMIWWHERGLTNKAADLLAKDIVVFDWHYGNQRSYPTLATLQGLGFEHVWATPAVTRYYRRNRNDFDDTFGNIRGFLTEAVERGVTGECTCTWVHGMWGGRNLFELNYYALLYSAQCAWKPANSDEDDFRWRYARHWFGLAGDRLAEDVMHAVHAPFGERQEQRFWRDCRNAEVRLAAAPAATMADIEKAPTLPADAEKLLAFCTRARKVLEQWRKSAKRNQVTIDFLLHDVHIYETLARRILALDELRRVYPAARGQRDAAALAPVVEKLDALAADYREIERMFARSIKEAGGGPCGTMPYAAGGVRFRAQAGRTGIEKLVARLKTLPTNGAWPERPW